MTVQRYDQMTHQKVGKPVEIKTTNGQIHRGIISRVDQNRIYLHPLPAKHLGGYGYGFGGYGGYGAYGAPYAAGYGGYGGFGGGYGTGWGWAIGLAAIAALIFIPFFW